MGYVLCYPPLPTGDPWELVQMPDTQAAFSSGGFHKQADWLAANAAANNILLVTHMGDWLNVDTEGGGGHAYSEAQAAEARGYCSVIMAATPMVVLPGRHDCHSPYTVQANWYHYTGHWNAASGFSAQPGWGGSVDLDGAASDLNMGSWYLFTGGGVDFILISLMEGPNAAMMAWAVAKFTEYSDRIGILSTHQFLDYTGARFSMGQTIWDSVVTQAPNVHFVLCGHDVYWPDAANVPAASRRADVANGHTVHQLFCNYQAVTKDGAGAAGIRRYRFVPAEGKIYATSMCCTPASPFYWTDPTNQFELTWP